MSGVKEEEAARILLDTNAVMINVREPFTYTSGKKGPVYVDCRRLISFTAARGRLMDMQAAAIRALCPDADFVAGGETAGIPYAAFLADRLNLPMLYVRKKPKGFGRFAQIEGYMPDAGKKVVLVEDVQNHGTSANIFIPVLREAGANASHMFVLFKHGHANSERAMQEMGLTVSTLTDWQAVLAVAKAENRFDGQALQSVETYLRDPEAWAA